MWGNDNRATQRCHDRRLGKWCADAESYSRVKDGSWECFIGRRAAFLKEGFENRRVVSQTGVRTYSISEWYVNDPARVTKDWLIQSKGAKGFIVTWWQAVDPCSFVAIEILAECFCRCHLAQHELAGSKPTLMLGDRLEHARGGEEGNRGAVSYFEPPMTVPCGLLRRV